MKHPDPLKQPPKAIRERIKRRKEMASRPVLEGIATQEVSQVVITFDAVGSAVFSVSLNQSQVTTGQLFALAGYFTWLAQMEAARNMRASEAKQAANQIAVAGGGMNPNLSKIH